MRNKAAGPGEKEDAWQPLVDLGSDNITEVVNEIFTDKYTRKI